MVANININITGIVFEGVDWIYLCMVQDRNGVRLLWTR